MISSPLRRLRPESSWFSVIETVQQKSHPTTRCGSYDAYCTVEKSAEDHGLNSPPPTSPSLMVPVWVAGRGSNRALGAERAFLRLRKRSKRSTNFSKIRSSVLPQVMSKVSFAYLAHCPTGCRKRTSTVVTSLKWASGCKRIVRCDITCGAIRKRLHWKRTRSPRSTFGIISSGPGPVCEKAFITDTSGTTKSTIRALVISTNGVKHLAKALHTIEDSYAPGHTKRTSGTGIITDIYDWQIGRTRSMVTRSRGAAGRSSLHADFLLQLTELLKQLKEGKL